MNFFAQIIIGGLAGWLSTRLMKKSARMGLIGNILLGILGAFVGDAVAGFLGMRGTSGLNISSLFVATLGSVIIIFVVRKLSK